MSRTTVITLQVPNCLCGPVRGLVYLALRRCHFPGTLEARILLQRYKKTGLKMVLQQLHKTVIAFTGASRPPLPIQIPIAWRQIQHSTLTPAVSSLEAYSTPAR